MRRLFFLPTLFSLLLGACSAEQEKIPPKEESAQKPAPRSAAVRGAQASLLFERPPSIPDLATGRTPPPTPTEFKEQMGESGRKWLYGPGLGRTVANVGTAIVFPPYALYLLGNAGLALAGQNPLYLTDALPETPRRGVLAVYDGVTSVPGRVSAMIAGEQYQAN